MPPTKKPPKISHRNCAWCSVDGICVPARLHQDFEAQLGARLAEFPLFPWYEQRTRERKAEMIVVGDIWTTWREEFRAELAFRGWIKPVVRSSKYVPPIQAAQMQKIATFGRTKGEVQKAITEYMDYKQKQAGS